MAPTPDRPTPEPPPPAEREPFVSLRLRLWVSCIAGGAVAGLGSLWVLGTRVRPESPDPATLLGWLSTVAFVAILAGLLFAVWLDHHIVGHLRGLVRGLRSGRVTELRGLPAASGWGELSDLTDVAQEMLGRQRRSARAAEDLERVRAQLATLQRSLEAWLRSESWEAPADPGGPLTGVAEALTRGFARRAAVDEQNLHAARQVAGELADAVNDAQESAEQSERGFVEATALLTTVRELQRLSAELQGALDTLGPVVVPAPAGDGVREALGALVEASQQSVDAIGRGMLRVQDVSELVQQLANRATLVAIHAVTAKREGAANEDLSRELRQLVQDVREATERTERFASEIEASVAEAGARMKDAREHAAAQLEGTSVAGAVSGQRSTADAQRLLERVREMVQDAARKGERLSAAGERASRAAERLSRRVSEESAEAQALTVRLSPVGSGTRGARVDSPSRELRLLEGESRREADAAAEGDAAADEAREEERP
jgi:hypothetical protein